MHHTDQQLVQEATSILEKNLRYKITIPQLASKLAVSQKKLERMFKSFQHMGIHEYLTSRRIEFAKQLLLEGATIKQVGLQIGYDYETNFIKAFRQSEGVTPAVWLRLQLDIVNKKYKAS